MKLPKKYFDNLTAARYREYLKLLPHIKKENTRIITMLIFTFVAMSIFGFFAINPTLSTITELKKQLADSTALHQQLTIKINNLSNLQAQYNSLAPDLPYVFAAIPNSPYVPTFMGQIQTLAINTQLSIISLQVEELELTTKIKLAKGYSYAFVLQASGTYDNIAKFLMSITQFSRIVTIEQVSLARAQGKIPGLIVIVRGRTYFD